LRNVDFIGVGAAKSGTSWLTRNLAKHPDIFIPRSKELEFFCDPDFNDDYKKGIPYYLSYFKGVPPEKVMGEYSNNYLIYLKSAELIRDAFPGVKLLFCFRNPADMIYSLYWWRKAGYRGLKFEDDFETHVKKNPDFLRNALYGRQMEPYFKLFPRDRILIHFFEDIIKNPKDVLSGTFRFLGVRDDFLPADYLERKNTSVATRSRAIFYVLGPGRWLLKKIGWHHKTRHVVFDKMGLRKPFFRLIHKKATYPKMSPETRKMLRDYYGDDIQKLGVMLDKDLSHWLA